MKNLLARIFHSDEPLVRQKLFWLMAPLTLLGLVLCICSNPLPEDQTTYMLMDATSVYTITSDAPISYGSQSLYTSANKASDVQLILPKGENVQLTTEQPSSLLSTGSEARNVSVTTRNETVANLLRRNKIQVADDEMVVVDLSGDSPHITVCRQYSRLRDVTTSTDYPTERIANPLMEKGTEQVITAGVKGSVTTTYLDTYAQGRLTDTEFVSATDDTAVTEVIEYGTMVSSVSGNDSLEDVHYNEDGSGYLLFSSGDTMAFSARMSCSATAYSIHGYTASGRPTRYGNIAVDPSVFPYGTTLYIYTDDGYLTYGMATAADCGTSIKGNKLDLWFDSYAEACYFGRRSCTVFVLD